MNAIAVDASVAVKWVVKEDGSEAAADLVDQALTAPAIFLAECANALWAKAIRAELTPEEVLERVRALRDAPVELVALAPLMEDATRLALEMSHPIYDCLYLALASQLDREFVTADGRFFSAVRRHGQYADLIRLLGEP